MNSGYFRQNELDHWFHIPEQHIALYDWAVSNLDESKEITNEQITGYKDGRTVTMSGVEILEFFETEYSINHPSKYKTILFNE